MRTRSADAMQAQGEHFAFAMQGLISRAYLSHAVRLRSHDHMNHCQQLRLINHSFAGREGGTEWGKAETRE